MPSEDELKRSLQRRERAAKLLTDMNAAEVSVSELRKARDLAEIAYRSADTRLTNLKSDLAKLVSEDVLKELQPREVTSSKS